MHAKLTKTQSCSGTELLRSPYRQRWSGRSLRPSSVGFSPQRPRCPPGRCGSAAAADTPRGQWKRPRAEASCRNHTARHISNRLKSARIGVFSIILFRLMSHLSLPSLALTISGPSVSISISAAPSLSWILQRGEVGGGNVLWEVCLMFSLSGAELCWGPYTAQWSGLKVLPLALLKTSFSSKTSTHMSWPAQGKSITTWGTDQSVLRWSLEVHRQDASWYRIAADGTNTTQFSYLVKFQRWVCVPL